MSGIEECALSRRAFLRQAGTAAACCAAGRLAAGGEAPPAPKPYRASFYEKLGERKVRCQLCPWGCVVPDGRRGHCRARENRDGEYYSLVYGKPVVMNNDPIEKKPFFHVYPGSRSFSIATVGCNFRCAFCQNWDISQRDPDEVSPRFVAPADIAQAAVRQQCRTIAYTYGEPIVFYEYMADCARAAKDLGVGNVMVSNGTICEAPLKKLLPLMTAIKIDLKAFTQKFYEEVCGGRLQSVLDTLKRIVGGGTWLEIVVLTIPTLNDNMDDIKRMADWIVKELGRDVPLHFTRFHPDYKLRNLPPTPLKTLDAARETAARQGCRFVYGGNAPGQKGEHTTCPGCQTIIVERYGHNLLKNIVEDNKCAKCGRAVPGIWK
ncbi:MAG: AmmeMemoRadiSam system radical SAM enzyme [Verrucomicrobiota bacterium]|nr:AmmeMemoRadiSam system radical SAM enzyme [Verrucomicrobiota bacterium]